MAHRDFSPETFLSLFFFLVFVLLVAQFAGPPLAPHMDRGTPAWQAHVVTGRSSSMAPASGHSFSAEGIDTEMTPSEDGGKETVPSAEEAPESWD